MTDVSVHPLEGSDTPVSLLVRLKRDEQSAWERLVTLYTPLVVRWCRQEGLRAADTADVGQEVFQAVARRIRDFRRDRPGDTFRGWLRIITRNKVRDYLRAHQAELPAMGGEAALEQLKLLPSGEDASDPADPTERTLLFRQAMQLIRLEFEETSWQAFWRTAVEGQAPADVARELAISVNAVYLARSRILRRFRDEFQDLVDPDVAQ